MAKLYLVEGPVGAGKSTLASKISIQNAAARFNLDEWMVTLFSPDRPDEGFLDWYQSCKKRCIDQIWTQTCDLLTVGVPVVLELGLVQQADRLDFYKRVDDAGFDLAVYVLDTPEEIRRKRVKVRNRLRTETYRMEVTDEVFNLANSMWQPPDETEIRVREIEFVNGWQDQA